MNKEIINFPLQSKIIILGGDLNSSTSFSIDLKQLGFKPDYFIVREISASCSNATDEQVCKLYCNLVADDISSVLLGFGPSVSNPQCYVDLSASSLNTNLLILSVQTIDGAIPSIGNPTVFTLAIEFHKK